MNRCIIHIGMHKTGSTSIQSSLNNFSDNNFSYADLGPANHSLAIYSLFSSTPEKHHLHQRNGRDSSSVSKFISEANNALERAISQASSRTLIISGEDISILPPESLLRFRDYLKRHFHLLNVVGYVRPPAGFINSSFQQRVKAGTVSDINLAAAYRNYRKHFEVFDDIFGRDQVNLWKFDPASFPDHCVVRDFCERLGIGLPKEKIIRLNESLSRNAIILLYIYHKFGRKSETRTMTGAEAQNLINKLKLNDGMRFRFSPDIITPVLDSNIEDIRWMEDRLNANLFEKLAKADPLDIQDETDLLTLDETVIRKLVGIVGDASPRNIFGKTPEDIALLFSAIRRKFSSNPLIGTNRGRIARVMPTQVIGWAIGNDAAEPVSITLFVNGNERATLVADQMRPGIKGRGLHPSGKCGFTFNLEANSTLSPGDLIEVKPLGADFHISNSPYVVGAEDGPAPTSNTKSGSSL